jgi:hypothetical protein
MSIADISDRESELADLDSLIASARAEGDLLLGLPQPSKAQPGWLAGHAPGAVSAELPADLEELAGHPPAGRNGGVRAGSATGSWLRDGGAEDDDDMSAAEDREKERLRRLLREAQKRMKTLVDQSKKEHRAMAQQLAAAEAARDEAMRLSSRALPLAPNKRVDELERELNRVRLDSAGVVEQLKARNEEELASVRAEMAEARTEHQRELASLRGELTRVSQQRKREMEQLAEAKTLWQQVLSDLQNELQTAISERDTTIIERDAAIKERDAAIKERDAAIARCSELEQRPAPLEPTSPRSAEEVSSPPSPRSPGSLVRRMSLQARATGKLLRRSSKAVISPQSPSLDSISEEKDERSSATPEPDSPPKALSPTVKAVSQDSSPVEPAQPQQNAASKLQSIVGMRPFAAVRGVQPTQSTLNVSGGFTPDSVGHASPPSAPQLREPPVGRSTQPAPRRPARRPPPRPPTELAATHAPVPKGPAPVLGNAEPALASVFPTPSLSPAAEAWARAALSKGLPPPSALGVLDGTVAVQPRAVPRGPPPSLGSHSASESPMERELDELRARIQRRSAELQSSYRP